MIVRVVTIRRLTRSWLHHSAGVVMVAGCMPLWAEAQDTQHATPVKSQPFEATVQVAGVTTCSADEQFIHVSVEAELAVLNRSDEPLILQRGEPTLYFWRIARDLDELRSQDWSHYSYYFTDAPADRLRPGASPDERFVVLAPDERYTVSAEWGLVFTETSGEWHAQVVVSPTVDWEPAAERAAAKAWSGLGRLWTRGIRSEPFRIVLDDSYVGSCEPATSGNDREAGR